MLITSVRIKNFRSIKSAILQVADMNIFVGLNDAGKSNYLKALNLFFNEESDYGVPFDFARDFSTLYNSKSHDPKEIRIEISFQIPDTYKDAGIYIWKKSWKSSGIVDNEIVNQNGDKPTGRSRIPGILKRIKYRYVPAVKSKEYFKSLLTELYITVSSVINSPLESSIQQLTDSIQQYTGQISEDVNRIIGMDSKIAMPNNMSELFRALIVETVSPDGVSKIPLDMRGDGIQAQHIPIILKYIADDDKKTRNRGSMSVNTIWGFEEPENGIELSRAFDMANNFKKYSSNIQMFITSHSPAFYTLKSSEFTEVFYTWYENSKEGTKVSQSVSEKNICNTMGLMPLVEPYILEQKTKLEESQKVLKECGLIDTPTIFVEGKTDKKYLELAIEVLSPRLLKKLNASELRIFTKEGQGGCKTLNQFAIGWMYSGNASKAMFLYDNDKAGITVRNELIASELYKKKPERTKIEAKLIEPSDDLIFVFRKGIKPPFEIEHLLSTECWNEIVSRNLFQRRSKEELMTMVTEIIPLDATILSVLTDTVGNDVLLNSIVLNNPHEEKKDKILQIVEEKVRSGNTDCLNGFKRTIDALEKYFL